MVRSCSLEHHIHDVVLQRLFAAELELARIRDAAVDESSETAFDDAVGKMSVVLQRLLVRPVGRRTRAMQNQSCAVAMRSRAQIQSRQARPVIGLRPSVSPPWVGSALSAAFDTSMDELALSGGQWEAAKR